MSVLLLIWGVRSRSTAVYWLRPCGPSYCSTCDNRRDVLKQCSKCYKNILFPKPNIYRHTLGTMGETLVNALDDLMMWKSSPCCPGVVNQSFRLSLPKDYRQRLLGFLGWGMVVVMVMLTELLRVFMGFEDCARGVTEKNGRKSESKSMRELVVPEQREVRCGHWPKPPYAEDQSPLPFGYSPTANGLNVGEPWEKGGEERFMLSER